LAQESWIEARCADLLPIPYFHVVFTLPHELNPLALSQPRLIYGLLFRAASATLQAFARDPKHLGGTPGLIAVLHTWSQNLSLHPHLHCIVTGGALADGGSRWIPTRHPGFLFPVRALSKVFRGKYLDALRRVFERGELGSNGSLPSLLGALRSQSWVVYAKPPFAGPESVLRYLGRYTHRIAISNHRILRVNADSVAFRFRDYADGKRLKVMELSVHEFIRRFLLHVLPSGFVRIRHYGLLANRSRTKSLSRCRTLLGAEDPPAPRAQESVRDKLLRLTEIDLTLCPACREGRMRVIAELEKLTSPALRIEILDSS
jgi:hypothetical protein